MSRTISGTSLNVYTETATGLILTATIDSGTVPATTNIYAPSARVIDLSTGIIWINKGTAVAPSFSSDVMSASITLSAAQIIAMYTTPVVVVPAVTGYGIILDSMEFDITRTATQFTGGGVVAVQYDSTANGAGTATTATIAATVVTGAAGRTITARIPVVQSDIASASIIGKGLYISNATAVFATGTGTAVVNVKYHLV